ncbi:MAG: hypothetical protein IPK19_34555 [Chloroflexi bacterium]|nr:hypothetical protein [Chloroflexota bacterium]
MADDLITSLRSLANKWALKARDFAREAKAEGADPETAAYNRGYAEGFYRAATELAEVIKGKSGTTSATTSERPAAPPKQPVVPERPPARAQPESLTGRTEPDPNAGGRWNAPSKMVSSASTSGVTPGRQGTQPPPAARPAAADAASAAYAEMPLDEVLVMFQYAGSIPRDVQVMGDNVFRAIFSRWENLTPSERQAKVAKADHRLVILESGFTKDTRDPYLDFAFKKQS